MRIQNRSRLKTAAFEKLLSYMEGILPQAATARFELKPRLEDQCVGGRASNNQEGAWPHLVELELPGVTREYPLLERVLPSLPFIELHSFEEEVLLVLAHELKHCAQYLDADAMTWEQDERELDAETFAYDVVERWRRRRAA